MTATELNNRLISIVLQTLHQHEESLTLKDKKKLPLIERTVSTILDVWGTNKVRIKKMEVEYLRPDMVWIKVNESSPVTFIPPRKEVASVA